jgi:hypothetical protein
MDCGVSKVRRRTDVKMSNETIWFKRWIDGETVTQVARGSGYSSSKIRRIILARLPLAPTANKDFSSYSHIVFDGKFLFGRRYCLLVIYDAQTNKPIASTIAKGENRLGIVPWLRTLRAQGLNPMAVTTDGNRAGVYSFREVWPNILTQRCLFHIKLQITAWARIPPRTELGRDLTDYVNNLFDVKNNLEARQFYGGYLDILERHKNTIAKLDRRNILERDLYRAMSVIEHAMPNLFHYLKDPRIAKTTSGLEGYFKQIQDVRGFRHCGLTEQHLFDFIKWKIYFDSEE